MPDFMQSIAAACGFALLSWWLGTGAILWLVRLKASSFRWSLALASAVLVLGLVGSAYSMRSAGTESAYLAFASVILMWSWHELAFLTGWLTGPRRLPLQAGARGTRRLLQSVQVVAYHELALLLNFAVLWALQSGQPNHVALCTFALLWCMRVSAKFNLFLGVPQTGAQYLPAHLSYLGSYFKRAPVTPFFFITLAVSGLTLAWLIWEVRTGLVAATTGWVLLATLLGLAIVEHVLMAFPLSIEKLWGWAMNRAASRPLADAAVLPTLPVVLPVHAAKADPP
ncbi:MAG: putative photosynthetic complex assembly protein PuhE [Betaproteobacteria bacterium]